MHKEIILINKESGWTSNDVVRKLKGFFYEKYNVKKIGHAGTLDSFATGLLLIMLNDGTKKFDEIQTLKKEYIAEIEFGKKTDTYDIDGEVIFDYKKVYLKETGKEFELDKNFEKELREKLSELIGKIKQIPPKYSALKINGKRASDLARKGREFEIKEREVEIYEAELISLENNIIRVKFVVSSGTYIRSLAYYLGEVFKFGAYLKNLKRTKIGNYKVEEAKKVSEILN